MKKILLLSAVSLMSFSAFSGPGALSPMDGYVPTDVSKSELTEIWKTLKTNTTDNSICSNRAMVWSYEMKDQFNVDSMKKFIHYTDAYIHIAYTDAKHISWFEEKIRKFTKGKIWYYHVAPAVLVNGVDYVLDREFRKTPVTGEQWEDVYTGKVDKMLNDPNKRRELISRLKKNIDKHGGSKREISRNALELIRAAKKADGTYETKCKKITHYAEHEFDKKAWCHIQNTSMYYWVPGDLRRLNWNSSKRIREKNYTQARADLGAQKHEKTDFTEYSVKQSYKQAFD